MNDGMIRSLADDAATLRPRAPGWFAVSECRGSAARRRRATRVGAAAGAAIGAAGAIRGAIAAVMAGGTGSSATHEDDGARRSPSAFTAVSATEASPGESSSELAAAPLRETTNPSENPLTRIRLPIAS
jgi:hypothetical protein